MRTAKFLGVGFKSSSFGNPIVVILACAGKKIYANHEIVIGRDKTRCQYVLDDPYTSKRHLRIYTVVYENDEPNEVDTLVYAEDLSQNGTYWNGAFIGKGNGGFLLSDTDTLRLSRRTYFVFTAITTSDSRDTFDFTQETEMAHFRREYVLTDRLLGAGAFGRVFMAVEQVTRSQLACKVVDLRKLMPKSPIQFGRPDQPAAAEDVDSRLQIRKVKAWADQQKRERGLEKKLQAYFREAEILASIRHPNIIGIEKVFVTDNTIYMMQDIVTAGDLFSYIESKKGKLLEVEAAVIIRQILVALCFLHQKNIVHRDIKPDNVLMTSLSAGCRVVLTDFGAARKTENWRHRMSTIIGTHEYAAPEILRYSRGVFPERPGYTRAVDMWALGCVSVVLLTGGLAFADPVTNTYSAKLARDCNLEFLRKSKDWKLVRNRPRDFVEKLLVLDEAARMTAEEAFAHSWFTNQIHKDDFEELYQRTIKHWRPRIPKSPIIDFQDSGIIKSLRFSEDFRNMDKSHTRSPSPIDPPYKPFPRSMHLSLWPKRDSSRRLSEEVLSTIKDWSPESAHSLSMSSKYTSTEERPPTSLLRDKALAWGSRHVRAYSEPPPDRSGFKTKCPLTAGDSYSSTSAITECKESVKPHSASKDDDQLVPVRRTPTPRLQGSFNRDHSTWLSSTESRTRNAATARVPEVDRVLKERRPTTGVFDPVVQSSRIPNALRVVQEVNRSMSSLDSDGDSSMSSATPQPQRKLKRRVSTPSINQKRMKRRESIFDLAEDGDSDGEPPFRKEPLVHRPKAALPKPSGPTRLYLPR